MQQGDLKIGSRDFQGMRWKKKAQRKQTLPKKIYAEIETDIGKHALSAVCNNGG